MTAYLFDNPAYPIVTRAEDILPALRDPFCRAVTLRDPSLKFDASSVIALPDTDLARRYWRDEEEPRGRRASGKIGSETDVSLAEIIAQAKEAKIVMSEDAAAAFTARCNAYRRIFTDVFEGYTGLKNIPQRGFALFTPVGGRGRSPELHIDNTILTLHWSAALAKFRLCNGEPDERTWNALDRQKQDALSPEEKAANFSFLVEAVKNATLDMRDNEVGDMMITKGQRGVDVSRPDVRKSLCVHVSSDTIIECGQAAYLMTPKMERVPA